MSSSRSIAAARNKRAGEQPVHQQQFNRPGTSISGQPAFAQQQQGGRYQQPQQRQTAPSLQQTNVSVPSTAKLSISDAIGLITLRLGRVEQIIQEGNFGNDSSSSGIPENTQIVDKSVINSIINRLDSLEKKEKESSSNTQVSKLEKELRDIKDALMIQMVKYEKTNIETDKRFSDIDSAFVELEKGLQQAIPVQQEFQLEIPDVNNSSQTEESVFDKTIGSLDLKNMIKLELASETV